MRVSASVHACAPSRSPWAAKCDGRPAQRRERVVVVVAGLPALEHGPAALPRLGDVALGGRDARERRGRVDDHVVVRVARRDGERGGEQAPRGRVAGPRRRGWRRAGPRRRRPCVPPAIISRHIRVRARPVAALAQHVGHARHAGADRVRVRARLAQLQRGVERLLGAAEVGRLVERHAEALVELGGDRGEVVLEREREAVADDLQPGARGRRAWRAPCPRPRARGCAGRCARRGRRRAWRPARARSPRAWRAASRRWLATAIRSTAASAGWPVASNASAAAIARPQRHVAVALELQHRGAPALGGGDHAAVGRGGGELAPGLRGVGSARRRAGSTRRSPAARRRGAPRRRPPATARAPGGRRRRRRNGRARRGSRRPRAGAPRGPARRRARRASAGRRRGSARPPARAPRPARGAACGGTSTGGRRRAPRASARAGRLRCRAPARAPARDRSAP